MIRKAGVRRILASLEMVYAQPRQVAWILASFLLKSFPHHKARNEHTQATKTGCAKNTHQANAFASILVVQVTTRFG